jgi:hypothetical protein
MLTYSLSRSLSTNPLPTSCCNEICARPSARHRRKNISCAIIQVAYRGKNEIRINISSLLQKMESRNIRECPVYPNLRPLALLACSAHPKSSAKCVGTNSVYLALRLAIRWLVRDIEMIRKISLSKFGANTYQKLTSTSPDVLQGL